MDNNKESEVYMLSPKGCAVVALLDAKLINDCDDEKACEFWRIFQSLMIKCGYVKIEDDEVK